MEDTVYLSPKQKNSNLVIIIGIAILVMLVVGGFFFMKQSPKKTVETNKVVVTKTPTPTEKPKIDKSTVKIQVVNGTGIEGQAAIVIKALTEAGYNSDNIKSSNAEIFDSAVFMITGRTDFNDIINDIVTILKPSFSNITISSSNLDETNLFDIVVLTGSETSTTTTISPTESITSTMDPTTIPTSDPSPTISPITTP